MKTNTTRNLAAESLNLPPGWHVDAFPGGCFTFERYDEHGRIVETRNSRDPHETAREIRANALPLKNGFHIKRDFPGTQTRTFGRDNFYTCEVIMPDGEILKGIGRTLESAEDTAWHAVKISLRESATLAP